MPRVGASSTVPSGGATRAIRPCIASTMPVTPPTPSTASRTPPRKSASTRAGRIRALNAALLVLELAARHHGGHRRRGPVRCAGLLRGRSVLLGFLRHLVAALVAFGH